MLSCTSAQAADELTAGRGLWTFPYDAWTKSARPSASHFLLERLRGLVGAVTVGLNFALSRSVIDHPLQCARAPSLSAFVARHNLFVCSVAMVPR